MNELRRAKLESLVLHLISKLISMQEVKDYRVGTDLSVTSAKMSTDGAYVDVFVSSFQAEDRSTKGVEGLNSAAGFIRRKLAPELYLRKIPIFRFHADHSFRMQMAIQEQLGSLPGVNKETNSTNTDGRHIAQNQEKKES